MQEHANEDVEKMILGNKCDMEDKRVISKERGETIARENGVPFLEVRCSELAHHEMNSVFACKSFRSLLSQLRKYL